MDSRDLDFFITIAKEKNMSRASKLLYISPQGLSKAVKRLEEEVGSVLLDRSERELRLTETGEAVFEYAKAAQRQQLELKKKVMEIEQHNRKVVDLVSAYGIIRFLSPERLLRFQQEYPDIEFQYHEYPDCIVEQEFLKGNGNIALSIGDFDEKIKEEFDIKELISFPVKLAVYKGHPLENRNFVYIDDLKDEPMYIENKSFKINHLITDRCREAGFEPNIVFETAGFSLCHKMVKKKKCISVTVDFVFHDMKEDNMIKIPFWDDDIRWRICLLKRKKEDHNEGVRIFEKYIEDEIDKRRK